LCLELAYLDHIGGFTDMVHRTAQVTPGSCASTKISLKNPLPVAESLNRKLEKPILKTEFSPKKRTHPQPYPMKLTDTQVNELIAACKASLQDYLEPEQISHTLSTWHDPQTIEDAVCGKDLWDELNVLDGYMSSKQVNRYTDAISLEIYKAVARAVRQHNPLLAKAFDLTK